MEADIVQMKEFQEQEMKTLRAKADAHVDSLKQEHEITKQKVGVNEREMKLFFQ